MESLALWKQSDLSKKSSLLSSQNLFSSKKVFTPGNRTPKSGGSSWHFQKVGYPIVNPAVKLSCSFLIFEDDELSGCAKLKFNLQNLLILFHCFQAQNVHKLLLSSTQQHDASQACNFAASYSEIA